MYWKRNIYHVTLSISRPGKGRGSHVSHFSEHPHHNWVSNITAIHDLRQPLNANRPPSAHLHPSRCVLTTTPSAARRSTLARCVCKSRRRFWEEFLCEGTTASRIRHSLRHNCRFPSCRTVAYQFHRFPNAARS